MPADEVRNGARTMWELVERRAGASPRHPMLVGPDGDHLTFGEFGDRSERVAVGLRDLGVEPGAFVSWLLPTRIDTVVLSIALSRLGADQNPTIHLYRQREVGFALRQTGASHFFIPRRWRDIDHPEMAERALVGTATHPEMVVLDDQLPGGIHRPSSGSHRDRTRRGPDPMDLLHLELDRRPPGGAVHRPDAHRRTGSGAGPRAGSPTMSAPSPFRSPPLRAPTIS